MSVRTRVAGPDDARIVAGLVAAGFGTYRAWAPPAWMPPAIQTDDEVDRIRRRLGDAGTWCLLAEARGKAVGHVSLLPPDLGGVAHLWHLFVLAEWWGTGLAALLLGEAVAEAGRRGYARIRLFTPRDHARARAFYRREGFSQRGTSRFEPELDLALIEYARDV